MKNKIFKFIEILFESLYYLVITYTLSSMKTSFNLHWYSVLFSTANIYATVKYYESVKKTSGSTTAAVIACILCFAVFVLLAWNVGYIRGEFTQFTSLF